METYGERAKEIINDLHTERLDYKSEYLPLMNCALKCIEYEEIEAALLAEKGDDKMMTVEKAIKCLEQYIGNDCYTSKFQDVCKLAISALCTQQEIEKNEPLTLEELREMKGEPVWFVTGAYGRWSIITLIMTDFIWIADQHGEKRFCVSDCGSGFLAYRYKLEGKT